jgi:hypothetical protein
MESGDGDGVSDRISLNPAIGDGISNRILLNPAMGMGLAIEYY